ncbi:MAG: MFS transporter [Caldilineaceae bacterium]|nr:MFS transporter [Caldilineaceae bacterium]
MTAKPLPTQPSPPAVTGADSPTHPVPDRFDMGQVMTIVGGHAMHDAFSAFLSPLLPILRTLLGANIATTGSLAIFLQLGSLLNPLIGYMADKVSVRYFVILAPAITATLMSSLGLVNSYTFLVVMLLATGISVAAFHAPAPAMVARVSGRQTGRGMSFFMGGGELGRTFGPILAATAVTWWGLEGMWRLAALGWLTSAVLYWRLRNVPGRPAGEKAGNLGLLWERGKGFYLILAVVLLPRAFMEAALTTYLPIFMQDVRMADLWLYSSALTILQGAGVVGALASGTLSDNWGRRKVLLALLISSPFFLVAFLYSPTWLGIPLLLIVGFTTLSPTPVLLALVQDQFPDNRAVANGLFLTLSFLIRALAIWAVGAWADGYGLVPAFLLSAGLAIFSVPGIFLLPKGRG